jgi:outer membrane protein OmpA-like peptidoglycan-associated protein
MRSARPLAIVAPLLLALTVACGPKHVVQQPAPPPQTLVVLLPDSETGTIGRVRVSNRSGAADLTTARGSTVTIPDRRPAAVTTLSEADVHRLFGEALAALPPPPRHFVLYFRFESDELTDDSRALLPQVVAAVKKISVPEVAVIGHTDTMGTRKANLELGLKRAATVRTLLVNAGVAATTIETTSHGEGNLLIKTADETAEPRNRRVEISVR